MARVLGLLLVVAACSLLVACAERDRDSMTVSPAASDAPSGAASDGPTATPVPERWAGELSGAVVGTVTGTIKPQCIVDHGVITVTLSGAINGAAVTVNVRSGGPGAFNLKVPADEGPSVDVAIAGETPGEWFVVAGRTAEDGDLTLGADGSGSVSATLPSITADQSTVTITANWSCPGV